MLAGRPVRHTSPMTCSSPNGSEPGKASLNRRPITERSARPICSPAVLRSVMMKSLPPSIAVQMAAPLRMLRKNSKNRRRSLVSMPICSSDPSGNRRSDHATGGTGPAASCRWSAVAPGICAAKARFLKRTLPSAPRHRIIAGMASRTSAGSGDSPSCRSSRRSVRAEPGGGRRPASQALSVPTLTPSRAASAFWSSPRRSRTARRAKPKIVPFSRAAGRLWSRCYTSVAATIGRPSV